jgi:hypothetical protein
VTGTLASVIPAQAEIQSFSAPTPWIPACAGMTIEQGLATSS